MQAYASKRNRDICIHMVGTPLSRRRDGQVSLIASPRKVLGAASYLRLWAWVYQRSWTSPERVTGLWAALGIVAIS